jgi:hypothetical protein
MVRGERKGLHRYHLGVHLLLTVTGEAILRALLAIFLTFTAAMTGIARAAECYLPWNGRPDLRAMWLQADCRYSFPPRDGFARAPKIARLKPGTVVDRFGYPSGLFLAPAGATYMGRSVPYDRLKMPYYRYTVVRPLRVSAGRSASWFDQPGGGIQYKTDRPIQALLDQGYLRHAW